MKQLILLVIIIISMIGMADAGYLTYEKIVGAEVVCGGGFDCGEVLNSRWANVGPVPLSLFGLFFYFFVFIVSIIAFLDIDLKNSSKKLVNTFKLPKIIEHIQPFEIIFLLTTFGFLFSLYLVFIMAFVIKAWCLFCLISAFSSTLLFLVSLIYFIHEGYKDSLVIKKIIFSTSDIVYKYILKPIFFLFNPTTVHNTMVSFGAVLSDNSLLRQLLTVSFSFNNKKLAKNSAGIVFPNPVGLSAGFDYNADLIRATPAIGFGFHTIGTITLEPYNGNAGPQLVRLPQSKSILVNKGLKNIGAKKIIKKLEKKEFKIPVGISIASTNKDYKDVRDQILDICNCFILFEKSGLKHSYYELNISCPNTFGGEPFTTPKRLSVLINALEKLHISRPVFVKMPIDQSEEETVTLLKILDKSFVAGVIFGNLTKDKNNPDITTKDKETWTKFKGNLSGKPTFNRSNALIKFTKALFGSRFVIIGTGGVFTPEDAQEKINLGADLVQLITGMIYTGPQLIGKINHHLYLKSLEK